MQHETFLLEALRQVIDPEVGLNIVDLGLVYRIEERPDGVVAHITMTSPACPLGEQILGDAEAAMAECLPPSIPARAELVWEPPWSPAMMSERARKIFGWDMSSLPFSTEHP